jgi:hypothetical protein
VVRNRSAAFATGRSRRPDQSEEAPEPVDDDEVFEEDESLELFLSDEDEDEESLDDVEEPFDESFVDGDEDDGSPFDSDFDLAPVGRESFR